MAAPIQIGKYLFNRGEMPSYARLLSALDMHKNGTNIQQVLKHKGMIADFGGDEIRAQQKVSVSLRNLRFRNIISETLTNGETVYKLTDKDAASEIIRIGTEISAGFQRNNSEESQMANVAIASKNSKSLPMPVKSAKSANSGKNANVGKNAVYGKNNNNNKVIPMADVKLPKFPKLFLNPETKEVELFGIGRPNAMKIALECDMRGNYMNKQAAAAFLSAMTAAPGDKSPETMKKAELLDLVDKLKDALAAVTAERDNLAEILASYEDDSEDEDEDEEEVQQVEAPKSRKAATVKADSCDDDDDDSGCVEPGVIVDAAEFN